MRAAFFLASCFLGASDDVLPQMKNPEELAGSVTAKAKPLNMLMIIADQHRWDATSERGNKVIHTPNLDKLAKEGVLFSKAYTICPVCAPSRTSMLAGRPPEQTKVLSNKDYLTAPPMRTYDHVLLRHGYHGEYWGKYHAPYNYTRGPDGKSYYDIPVEWMSGPRPDASGVTPRYNGSRVTSTAQEYSAYLDKEEPLKQLVKGQLLDGMYQRPYWPDIADKRYNEAFNESNIAQWNKLISEGNAKQVPTTSDEFVNGRLDLSAKNTHTALTLRDGLAALDRLKDKGPFALTVSFQAPHPPFLTPEKYYNMYPAGSIPDPETIQDTMMASPYKNPRNPSGNQSQVRHQASNYYGMIKENDDAVGTLLGRLDHLGLTASTLVIYVSDHGEMLGDHHMISKMVFYEGSVHIPLIMKLPGVMPAGKIVRTPVSNLDLFATITDYLGLPGKSPSTSESLRSLIKGPAPKDSRTVFSYWNDDIGPGYMVFDGRFKLMIGRKAKGACDADNHCDGYDQPGVDALYDLAHDPHEVINLLRSPYVTKPLFKLWPGTDCKDVPQTKAQHLKKELVDWLHKIGSHAHASSISSRRMNTSHINQTVMLYKPLPDITWQPGQSNILQLPAHTFVDVENDTLSFALHALPALPSWLTVDSKDGSVKGTPPGNHPHCQYRLRLTATDKTGSAFVELKLFIRSGPSPTLPRPSPAPSTFELETLV